MRILLMNLLVRYPAIAWLLGAVGLVLIFIGMSQLRDFHHIQQAGVRTQGTLIFLQGDADHKADIEYAFDADGKHYTGHGEVGVQERTGLHPGDKIEVRYLAGNPVQNITSASWPSTSYGFNLVGGVLILLPFAIMVQRRRKRRQ